MKRPSSWNMSGLRLRLEANEITDLFAAAESEFIKEMQPQAQIRSVQLTTLSGNKIILIDYDRPGINRDAEGERVRHYSIVAGEDLYRVTCIAAGNRFAQYEPVFHQMARSLTITGETRR